MDSETPPAAPPPTLRALYDAHAGAVRRFLGDLLRDDAAADEATQETFVRAHGRLESLRAQDRALPWLFGIARNVFYEERRRRGRLVSRTEDDERDAPVSTAPSPELLLLGAEANARLAAALAQLGEERRAALLLRLDHGLDYDEIATIMGWNASKVKNEIHRGRLVLRAELSTYLGGEDASE